MVSTCAAVVGGSDRPRPSPCTISAGRLQKDVVAKLGRLDMKRDTGTVRLRFLAAVYLKRHTGARYLVLAYLHLPMDQLGVRV